uniref:RNase H domain-containing protein n=1 Tax=Syphacia muris TaxID=451379 RepID=A0A0N5AAI4_9BILA
LHRKHDKICFFSDGSFKLNKSEWRINTVKDNYGLCQTIWQFANGTVIEDVERLKCIGYGWNKRVFQLGNFALKTMNLKGNALKHCFKSSNQAQNCLSGAVNLLIRGTMLLIKLQNDGNVQKLYAYCIPHDPVDNAEHLAVLVQKSEQLDNYI